MLLDVLIGIDIADGVQQIPPLLDSLFVGIGRVVEVLREYRVGDNRPVEIHILLHVGNALIRICLDVVVCLD